MNVSDFNFDLPDELIAQSPAPERGGSRLLVLHKNTGQIEHTHVSELATFLGDGDLLVVNDTRVFPARLLGVRVPSGGAVECLLLAPLDPDRCRGRPGRRGLRTRGGGMRSSIQDRSSQPGAQMVFRGSRHVVRGEILERHFHGRRTIRLWVDGGGPLEDAIDDIGHVPLPPYIKRDDTVSDRERYQTVYARVRGSVAAPTAGLHFTPELLDALEARGVGARGHHPPCRLRHVPAGARRDSRSAHDRRRTVFDQRAGG